ncbi:MAG: hypothetical protein GX206_08590 [Clostridiales bacterium]|mgnify:CR=1 FL=1|nr:hypothetical protein [Clostridiales bacterium]
MWNISEEIRSAANRLMIKAEEIPTKEAEEIINKVITIYARGNIDRYIWERVTNEVAINHKDAWQWINTFISNSEAIMFFNPSDEKKAYRLSNGDDVVTILSETYGFEFYITNKEADYLLCFNHHDVLIACGSAKEWLREYKEKQC